MSQEAFNRLNPESALFKSAVIGGAGIAIPPAHVPPKGMSVVVLYVPENSIRHMTPQTIQKDLGLPWSGPNGEPVWLEQ